MEFLKRCPECGHRFHVTLVTKKLVGHETVSMPTKKVVRNQYRNPRSGGRRAGSIVGGPPAVIIEGRPIINDISSFQYVYKCGYCRHEWFEKRIEERKVGRAQ